MDVLQHIPYREHCREFISWCKEFLPKSITTRAVLVGLTTGVLAYHLTKKRYRLPPGPRGLPLLGNLLDFKDSTIYEKLIEWQEQYGPIITFRVGPALMIGLNSADVILEAFQKMKADFAGRPQSYSTNMITNGGKSLAFGDYSPTWKLHRRMATKALRHYMTGSNLEECIERTLASGIRLMEQQEGPFNPHKITSLIMFNMITSVSFSYTCDIEDPHFTNMVRILDFFTDDFGNGVLEDFIPPLRLWPTKRFKLLINMGAEFMQFVNNDINKHRQSFKKDNIRDLCDAMLLAQNEAREEEDPELMAHFTDEHVSQTMGDIYGAGLDSSRYTLLWAYLYLVLNPDVQRKVHEELDAALGSRKFPKLADRPNLVYVEAVLHEVMRISAFAPLSLPHKTICDTQLGGYEIPKGTTVLPNLYAALHDPKAWTDPEVFRPERFLDANGKMAPKPDSWLVFSAGRRVCLGESVAKPELHLLLAGVMRHFKMSLPPGVKVNMELRGGSFSNIPNDFQVVLEQRP